MLALETQTAARDRRRSEFISVLPLGQIKGILGLLQQYIASNAVLTPKLLGSKSKGKSQV